MHRRGVRVVSISCLLIAFVVVTESGSVQSGVAGNERKEAPSLVTGPGAAQSEPRYPFQAADHRRTNATASSVEDAITGGRAPGPRGERERVERADNEQPAEDYYYSGGEDEDEGEDESEVDEDEDEPKAVAESHEAMSRDDTRNSNAPTAASTGLLDGTSAASKNFDSREVITVDTSDEDVASNEAINDELDDKYDKEVAELLKYKKERNPDQTEGGGGGGGVAKTKRVPTVKKELSTQREILIGSNETQVPKSLLPPQDPANRLNEETEAVRRRHVESSRPTKLDDREGSGGSRGEAEAAATGRYSAAEADSPKKLDKRQETAREDTLAEVFLKLLVKLVEDPDRWERVQKLLVNAENELNLSRSTLDASKRSYEPTSTLFPATVESSSQAKKSRKKSRKKKKKPKHRPSTTTLTPVPATPPLLTTTETPWQTTPVQWRLVAERLFGQPWQQDPLEESGKTATPRYSAPQGSARGLPSSIRELIERDESKSGLKSVPTDRKPIPSEQVRELGNQRLLRLEQIEGRQPGRGQPHRQFENAYDRPTDPDRMPDYDIPESYHRLRYNQAPPVSRDFLRRREEDDYRRDFNVQSDGYPRDQEFEPQPRDFALSKSWPDLAYGYRPPWRAEEQPGYPMASENWSWRQPPSDVKYWPQRGSIPVEKNYWPTLNDEEEADREVEAEKMWQQQRAQHSWNKHRPPWSEEKPAKVAPSWHQAERPGKLYDRDQSTGVWEKSKNRSDSIKSSAKQETKDKVVLPQISMKTWNSLTSDPATWPQKLPGAKPWPKDENGKSYNPNADLVKKLGLDKQNEDAWAKRDSEKSNEERKIKANKDDRLFSSKEFAQGQELPRTESAKYIPTDGKSNFSDYKSRSSDSVKSWAILADSKGSKDWTKSGNLQGDDPGAWRRKYEQKEPWTGEAALPKIQSVGAWVMAADQSTWKPYQIKSMEPSEESPPGRWSKSFGRSGKGSWSEKVNDSWMDRSEASSWADKTNVAEIWPGKANKPGSWFAKHKDPGGWPSKSVNSDSWKMKDDWSNKPESSSWTSKVEDDSWPTRGGSWSTKSNESWTSKNNDDVAKFNGDAWPVKVKEEDSVDAWTRKTNDRSGWVSKGTELSPWQQKISDEWSYGKSSSAGTWPSKWKQFAYHRVTALPISKPGTTADASASKSRNAFVAVSAVSSPKYTGNEWRKLEEEGRAENGRADEPDRTGNQPQVGLERPVYAWKKDSGLRGVPAKSNASGDPLENQLEALRQIDFWTYKENEAEKRVTPTSPAANATPSVPTNSTSSTTTTAAAAAAAAAVAHRRAGLSAVGNGNGLLETSRRTISMK